MMDTKKVTTDRPPKSRAKYQFGRHLYKIPIAMVDGRITKNTFIRCSGGKANTVLPDASAVTPNNVPQQDVITWGLRFKKYKN